MDGFDADTRRRMAAIEANWDERTPIHLASRFYERSAEDWFADYEWADLGDIAGRDVLHLQCHLGTETAAFALGLLTEPAPAELLPAGR